MHTFLLQITNLINIILSNNKDLENKNESHIVWSFLIDAYELFSAEFESSNRFFPSHQNFSDIQNFVCYQFFKKNKFLIFSESNLTTDFLSQTFQLGKFQILNAEKNFKKAKIYKFFKINPFWGKKNLVCPLKNLFIYRFF